MRLIPVLRGAQRATARSAAVFVKDVGDGLLEVSHNTLALVGLAVVAVMVFAAGRDDVRHQAEQVAFQWLQTRQDARGQGPDEVSGAVAAAAAAEPATSVRGIGPEPKELTRQQAAVARWIARRYKVAVEPMSALVQQAWDIGQRAGLDPTLLLAIMAVESSFNPFAQSPVGAQGLMQVMTRVHDDKYVAFGGNHAAFDPISNLRVGVQVLKECIARAGGLREGLRHYVGAALIETDGGYVGRVLTEQAHMRNVADGRAVPVSASNVPPASVKEADAAPQVQSPPRATPSEPLTSVPEGDAADQVALLR